MRKKKRVIIAGLAAAAAAAMIGGTWAVWTQQIQAGNEYQIAKYSTRLEENFDPPENWQPGISVEKAVWVTNDSPQGHGAPVLAKVELSQRWIRQENVYMDTLDQATGEIKSVPVEPLAGEPLPLIFQPEGGERQFAAVPRFNQSAVVALASGRNQEPGLRLDIPSVNSIQEAEGKWLLVNESPALTGNYVFYYMGVLQPGEASPRLLESVAMNPLLENTVSGSYGYYEKQEDGYHLITMETKNSANGYDSCRYTLDVTATTVQNTKAAVEKVFGSNSIDQTVVSYLTAMADSGIVESELTKRLSFERSEGRFVYTPYRDQEGAEEGNWFMSFTDMMPGGVYRDKLQIENNSSRDFRVYMQVLPRAQDALRDELLSMIQMSVWHDGTLLYQGNASGSALVTDEGLQRLVYLGRYDARSLGEITVELKIDEELALDETGTCKYADLLTKIDWEFMVTELDSPGGPGGGGTRDPGNPGRSTTVITDDPVPLSVIDDGDVPLSDGMIIKDEAVPLGAMPKTGDTTPWIPLTVTFLVSGGFLGGMMLLRRKEQEKESGKMKN